MLSLSWLALTQLSDLQPCGRKAIFEITEDGGTNFAATVRIPRLQPDKLVSLDFGDNSVSIRPSSIEGDARLVSHGESRAHVFELRSHADTSASSASELFPPGAFSFRADGLPSSPFVACDLGVDEDGQQLEAFSPSPPPPPPYCGASLIWRNDRNWGGGFAAFVDIRGSGVAPGFVVKAQFNGQQGLELLAAEGATLHSFVGSELLLRPDAPTGTISLRIRGKQGTPQLRCVPEPAMPPPPPSPCALGVEWQLTDSEKEDHRYQASVTIGMWNVGTIISMDLGPGREAVSVSSNVELIQGGAGYDDRSGTVRVKLMERPVATAAGDVAKKGTKGSFKLTYSGSAVEPFISCSYIAPPPPPAPPPYPPWPVMTPLSECPLGASYILLKSFRLSYSVDIALRSWVAGTVLSISFPAGTRAPASSEISDCFGCEVDAASTTGELKLRLTANTGLGLHNGGIGYKVTLPSTSGEQFSAPEAAKITCNARMPPPPAPPPPPWCALRPKYVVTARNDADHGRNGREMPMFEAEIKLEDWEVGAELTVEYLHPVRVVSAWFGKQTSYTPTSTSFELLAMTPPPMKIKFTARGNADVKPMIACVSSLLSPPFPPPRPPLPPRPPPKPPGAPPPPPSPGPPPYHPEPDQPEAPEVSATSCHSVALTWTSPGLGDEKLPILEYAVLYRDNQGTHIASGSVASTSFEVGGLRTGGVYQFQLRAHNARGWSIAGQLSESFTIPSCSAAKPLAPTALRLITIGSCSARFKWQPPAAVVANPAPVTAQELRAVPVSADGSSEGKAPGAGAIITSIDADATEGDIIGLQPLSEYAVTVRQRNAMGWSLPSSQIIAKTQAWSANTGPSRPMAPFSISLKASDVPDPASSAFDASTTMLNEPTPCTSLLLRLPALRTGCDQDDFLTLEWMTAPGLWTIVPASQFADCARSNAEPACSAGNAMELRSSTVSLIGLQPYKAYTFRLIAHNRDGSSEPSHPSEQMLTPGITASAMVQAPGVTSTSAASFQLSWPSQRRCRPEMRWSVSMVRENVEGTGGVLVINSSVTEPPFGVNSVRCHNGCKFAVGPAPGMLREWDFAANEPHLSPTATTPSLPGLEDGVVRVELMLVYGFADEDLLLVKQEMMNELAQSLRIAEDSFSIVLMYAAGQYTIVDFFSASSSSESVLQQLLHLASDVSSVMFDGRVLSRLAMVKRLYAGEKEEVLLSSIERRDSGFHKVGAGELIQLIVSGLALLMVGGVVGGICYGVCKTACASQQTTKESEPPATKAEKKSLASNASILDTDVESDEESDEEIGKLSAVGRRAANEQRCSTGPTQELGNIRHKMDIMELE